MKQTKITVKDIAKVANVSTATVSLALSGKQTRISEGTRNRILAIARDMNYTPNLIAQSLATNKSNTLGMIIPNLNDQIFTKFTSGVEQFARLRGFSLLICNSDDSVDVCIDHIKVLESRGVDGMAIIPPADTNEPTQLEELHRVLEHLTTPYILVDRAVHNLFHDYVASDNTYGGYLAGAHLVNLGHSIIGCIGGPSTEYGTIKRLVGFRQALSEGKIPFHETLLIYSDYTTTGGYEAAIQLINKGVTAIFALNDMMAIGAYRAAATLGFMIPNDLSIIGYDNSPSSELVSPPLSTISQPFDQIGEKACEILLNRIEDPERPNKDYLYEPTLIIRHSTKKLNTSGNKVHGVGWNERNGDAI